MSGWNGERAPHIPSNFIIPGHKAAIAAAAEVSKTERHPGLWLDRFAAYENGLGGALTYSQGGAQKENIDRLLQMGTAFRQGYLPLLERQKALMSALQAESWNQTTRWNLAIHLSRASGLENGAISLHPIHGFPWLPGAGLKGLTRAWAELKFLDEIPVEGMDEESFTQLFGSPSRTLRKNRAAYACPEIDSSAEDSEGFNAGAVVFHDAWPAQWVQIKQDYLNNLHGGYYDNHESPFQNKPEGKLASFLVIPPATAFQFWLSPRRRHDNQAAVLARLARTWLTAALQEMGAGAKTAAGYGYFHLPALAPAPKPALRESSPAAPPVRAIPAPPPGPSSILEDEKRIYENFRRQSFPQIEDKIRGFGKLTQRERRFLLKYFTDDGGARWLNWKKDRKMPALVDELRKHAAAVNITLD